MRILIVRPSALGDVCRSVPVLASLRAALPEAHLAWLVQDDFAAAIEAHPALSEVIAFPRNRLASWWRDPRRAAELWRWIRAVRRRRFDIALDCQGLGRSGLIALASGASLRVGLRSAREFAWLCYNRRVPADASALPLHTVDQMLCVLEALNIQREQPADMRLYVARQHAQWWSAHRTSVGMAPGTATDRPYAVIAPGSRWESKRWPIDRFADLIEPLLRRGFSRVVMIGSPAERDQVRPLLQRFGLGDDGPNADHPIVDLVGRTSIGQTMAVLAGAGLVVANDSAPLHMAVGLDRPCVALFGPTNPAEVGPYGLAECVVRAYRPAPDGEPNFKDARLGDSLMRLISSAMVLQHIDRVLALWPTRERPAFRAVEGGHAAASVDAAARLREPKPVAERLGGGSPESHGGSTAHGDGQVSWPRDLEPKAAS